MGKKHKGGGHITEADTFSVGAQEYATGMERREWGRQTRIGVLDPGEYQVVVRNAERTPSQGQKTHGCPQYHLTLGVIEGDSQGRVAHYRVIGGYPNLLGRYLSFLDAIGVEVSDPSRIPLVSERATTKLEGKRLTLYVSSRPDDPQYGPQRNYEVGPAKSSEADSSDDVAY